jgi:hypothetical protein
MCGHLLVSRGKMFFTIPCAEGYQSESLGAKRPVPKVTSFPPPASRSNPHVQSLSSLTSPLCFFFASLSYLLSRLTVRLRLPSQRIDTLESPFLRDLQHVDQLGA